MTSDFADDGEIGEERLLFHRACREFIKGKPRDEAADLVDGGENVAHSLVP